MSDDRLDRIEKKLDDMAKAIVSLARMEERMLTLFKRMDAYDEGQKDIAKRVRSLEDSVGTNGQALRFAERLFWIIASAGVASLFYFVRGGVA